MRSPLKERAVAPVVLAILDGWGERTDSDHNAIRSADTPVMDALRHAYPQTLIQASGSHVGLPDGQMGNSEVGHLTIGAGRIIRQELVRIGDTVRDKQLGTVPSLQALAERLRTNGAHCTCLDSAPMAASTAMWITSADCSIGPLNRG